MGNSAQTSDISDIKYPAVLQELHDFPNNPYGIIPDDEGLKLGSLIGRAGGTIQALAEIIAKRDAEISKLKGQVL